MLKDAEALNRGQSKHRQHYGTFQYLSTDQINLLLFNRIRSLITKMFPNASENLVDILKTRYISKTDTALQFYTTKVIDYSVER